MKNRIAIIVAVLLCSVILFLSFLKSSDKKELSYDVVFFGDSIIAGDHSERDLPTMLSEMSEKTVLNAAFGGTTMSLIESSLYSGSLSSVYTMAGLSDSIKNKDFSLQVLNSQKENLYILDYWYDTSLALSKTDFSKVKYILIEQGANDYLNGVPIDNPADKYDRKTYAGALRSVLENIQEAKLDVKVVLCTPIYMCPEGTLGDCYEVDYGGGILKDYVEEEKEIAEEYGVYVIDNFSEVKINRDNFEEYIPGGLHGNGEGNRLIVENIVKHLKELDERD